ncbi:MAG TPA: chorismate-binding protein, partial [Thermoanaerobaculia bacterium]|nr:chorismate-binding protein [Thermoanaerobaculia bacterium]
MSDSGERSAADRFDELRRDYDVIPLFRRLPLEDRTAVSVLDALDDDEPLFVLEKFEQDGRRGRYSIVGVSPRRQMSIEANGKDLLPSLRAALTPLRVLRHSELPPFTGGAAGYFGYGASGWIERIPDRHRKAAELPDAQLFWFDDLVVIDHVEETLFLVTNVVTTDPRTSDLLIAEAEATLATMTDGLAAVRATRTRTAEVRHDDVSMRAGISREEFVEMVRRARREIEAGEIFQVVLSQRWETDFDERGAIDLYRVLRELNPSPYTFLMRLDGCTVVGASPELLVGLHDGVCETRPIAGTRPRGGGEEEDALLARDLLDDPKENAEHLMLLDLGRNDLGRVSDAGSVHVTQFREVERYSHVSHMVSHVEGALRPDRSALDLLLAAFPAGTVSGAPKIRAMELIDEIEPVRRGIYSGAIVWFGYDGSL